MESAVNELEEIEEAAQAIVAKAQEQKADIDKEIQQKQDEYDAKLEADTKAQIDKIHQDGTDQMNRAVESISAKGAQHLADLKVEYAQHHTEYAQEILKNILEG